MCLHFSGDAYWSVSQQRFPEGLVCAQFCSRYDEHSNEKGKVNAYSDLSC